MTVRVAINGFGRIGRNILRAIAESGRKDIEVVAVNDLAPVETNAHLLRYDSVHGRFPGEVTVDGDSISLGNGKIKVTAIKDPATLPWKDLGVDIAMECTGIFTSKDKAKAHLDAGAKRVLVSAPADGADLTVVYGVNHDKLTKDHLVVLAQLVVVDLVADREVGAVGGRRDQNLAGAGLEMAGRRITLGEHARAFQHDVHLEILPGQVLDTVS